MTVPVPNRLRKYFDDQSEWRIEIETDGISANELIYWQAYYEIEAKEAERQAKKNR